MRTLLLTVCASTFSYGSITFQVYPSIAPNIFGSPGWAQYASNAIFALGNGLAANGTPNTPSYYQQQSLVTPQQLIVTGFPSWDGLVDPGTVFGPAYANEFGTRGHFGLVIHGNGTQFSISELSFQGHSNDPADLLNFAFATGAYNYTSNYVGIIFGIGGNPNTDITSGPNTQLVDALVGKGSGNADPASCPGCSLAGQQAAINALSPAFAAMTQFTGKYTLTDLSNTVLGSGSGTFAITPEPSTVGFLAAGLASLALLVRKRRATL